jgi:hypothetical protein
LVTPAVEEDRSSVGDALQDASSFSYSDSSSGSSSTISQQLENSEHQEIHGHRLIYMPSLCSAIEECTTCRLCGAKVTEALFEGFLVFVEVELENLKRKQDSFADDEFNIRQIYLQWKKNNKMISSTMQIKESTNGLATELQFSCCRCDVLSQVRGYRREWSNHKTIVSAKKTNNKEVKSPVCRYDLNIKYCTALQVMGVGGEHAAIVSAFLDLPEPHKWPRQFSVLEKHLYSAVEEVKLESQIKGTNEEVTATLNDEDHPVEQTFLQRDIPIHRIEASFDMGWQVRSSGGKYGSSTGHALLIGARSKKVLDSTLFNKTCGICTKHERCTGSLDNVRMHICVKNYEGSSKSMEAAALVKMLIQSPEVNAVSVCTVISDDDSNARSKARHESNGGLLPLTIEEPKFLADPSHRKRVFAKSIYNLANASAKVSTVTKGLAAHIKYCYGACVKRYRHLSAEQLSEKVYNILEHVSGNHDNCDESWCYDRKAMIQNKTYQAPADHRIDKVKHKVAYEQLKKIFDTYANHTQMGYCNHLYDTQTNEAMNQAVANAAPKSVCYSSTTSLNARLAIVIGIHNLGHLPFFTKYYDSIGVQVGDTLSNFLLRKQSRKIMKRTY